MKKQAFNPYLPEWEYIPDGEPRVFGDRVYIFGSHDKFGEMQFCQNDYVSWSAPLNDLANWTYGGVTYKKTQDPRNRDGKYFMEAPDVVEYKGEYYLFYSLSFLSSVAVAKAKNPEGPFEYYGLVHHKDGRTLGEGEDKHPFDPAVFIDDDGEIYLYSGSAPLEKNDTRNLGSEVMKLEPDMLTIKEEPKDLIPSVKNSAGTGFEGHEFYEASSMRKIDGKYYFIYSSVVSYELCYAVSDYPDKGFVYGGVIVNLGDIGINGRTEALNPLGNTHGSLIEINGQWYIFYHRQTNRTFFARQACAERVEIKNGKIAQVEVTSCGLNGKPLLGVGEYPARISCVLVGPDGKNDYNISEDMARDYLHGFSSPLTDGWIENTKTLPYLTQDEPDGEGTTQYIKHFLNGACAGYRYFSFEKSGTISVVTRGTGKGKFAVCTELGGKAIAKIPVTPHEGWTKSQAVALPVKGTHALYFRYEGEGETDFLKFILE